MDKAGNGQWRISKDIPISVVGFIVLQTILLTWFLAGQSAKLTAVVDDNTNAKAAAYTKDDARKDRELMDSKLINVQNKEDEITRRMALIEAQQSRPTK